MWMRVLCVVTAIMSLSACVGDTQFTDLRAQMDEIKKRPKGNIEPPPEFKAYTSFAYSAAALRSPFSPPMDVELIEATGQKSAVQPDLERPKEALEEFGIDSLSMVGTLNKPGNVLFALVQDTNGGLHRIAVGNYMGRNHGKVFNVTPQKIDVIEIVSDGQDGWIERPRTIALREQK